MADRREDQIKKAEKRVTPGTIFSDNPMSIV